MTNKLLFHIALSLVFINALNAQTQEGNTKSQTSIAVGVGVLTFNGDVGREGGVSTFGRIKTGYNLTIEHRIKKFIGAGISATYGKIADSDNSKINGLNFQSQITQVDLNLFFHLDNDVIFKQSSSFAPYLFSGVGFLKFDPYTDLKDKNGTTYHYWADGTIHNLPENHPQAATSKLIQRDYEYETQLTDATTKYNRSTLAVPVGLGVTLKLANNWGLNLGGTYYFTFSDWLDNTKVGANDKYFFASASLKYSFGKQETDINSTPYKSVDFASVDKTDTDNDGVIDGEDRCPGTPKDVKTDNKGCPLDKDGDGVPDYKDKEVETKKGSLVDENGVTITEKMLTERQAKFDSVATERSQLFNENPSLKYLQELETVQKNTNTPKNIPIAYKPVDSNSDGFVASEEILDAIDRFLQGEESSFTVEKINDLIDYFFEQ
jgi:hypothetical protein